jgi:hypothetical protein
VALLANRNDPAGRADRPGVSSLLAAARSELAGYPLEVAAVEQLGEIVAAGGTGAAPAVRQIVDICAKIRAEGARVSEEQTELALDKLEANARRQTVDDIEEVAAVRGWPEAVAAFRTQWQLGGAP